MIKKITRLFKVIQSIPSNDEDISKSFKTKLFEAELSVRF